MVSKIKTRQALARIAKQLRQKGKKIVFTNGCFDLLHAGHVAYLERARRMGDVLMVGLNSDRSIRRIKGAGRPINAALDRARVLGGLWSVDYVSVFNEPTPLRLIRLLKPHVLAKGSDWSSEDIVGGKDVLNWGGRIVRVPLLRGRSTTSTLERIRARKRSHAEKIVPAC